MTDKYKILSADFVSENTEDLIQRAESILGGYPRIGPRADSEYMPVAQIQSQTTETRPTIKSLGPACNRIVVRNVLTVVDSSIIICTGAAITTCPTTIPAACPTGVTPLDFVNMLAIVNALAPQNGVIIRFQYLVDDVPTTTAVTANLIAGNNLIYGFTTNVQYPIGTSLTLYGVSTAT